MSRVFLILAFLLCSAEALAGAAFQSPVKINDSASQPNFHDTYSSGQRSIAVDKNNIAVVWNDSRNGNNDIFFSFSRDSGRTFSKNIRVNDDNANSNQWYAAAALDKNGASYAVWEDDRDGRSAVYFAKKDAKNDSFSKNLSVSPEANKKTEQFGPAITLNKKGEIYIAWHDNRNGNNDIFLAKSEDGGKTFGKPVMVNDEAAGASEQFYPAIAVDDNGAVYFVWYDFRSGNSDIYFSKSSDGGKTFSKNIKVNFGDDEGTTTGQNSPSIAADKNGNVYIAWEDKRNQRTGSDVYFARFMYKAEGFEKNLHIDDENAENNSQNYPTIAVNNKGIVAIAWDDDRSGSSDIYLSYSIDSGLSFSKNIGLGIKNNKHRTSPSAALDDEGNIYLLYQEWYEDRKGNDIYFVKGKIK